MEEEEEAEGPHQPCDLSLPSQQGCRLCWHLHPAPHLAATLGVFVSPGHRYGMPVVSLSCISGGTHLADAAATCVYPLPSCAGAHTITAFGFSLTSIYIKRL